MPTWEDYQKAAKHCDPQSLMGYARYVHEACGVQCMYCGMGPKGATGPEAIFDLWRQLTVEHIVPQSRMPPLAVITTMLPQLVGRTPDSTDMYERIDRMNTVTVCHFCNSLTSRYSDQEAVEGFWQTLHLYPKLIKGKRGSIKVDWTNAVQNVPSAGTVEGLAKDVAVAILAVWSDKAGLARKKTCWLRRHEGHKRDDYSAFAEDCKLPPLPQCRKSDSPDDIDSRVKAIIMEEWVRKVELSDSETRSKVPVPRRQRS